MDIGDLLFYVLLRYIRFYAGWRLSSYSTLQSRGAACCETQPGPAQSARREAAAESSVKQSPRPTCLSPGTPQSGPTAGPGQVLTRPQLLSNPVFSDAL